MATSDSEIILSPTALAHIAVVPRQAKLGLPCYVENAYELLGDATYGRPGDYYHDAPAKKIYYVSPAAPTSVVLPQSKALVTLNNARGVSVHFRPHHWRASFSHSQTANVRRYLLPIFHFPTRHGSSVRTAILKSKLAAQIASRESRQGPGSIRVPYASRRLLLLP